MRTFKRNAYGRVADTLGVERYQSVPLYLLTDTLVPERYGQDGELTRFLEDREKFVKAEPIFTGGEWMIPKKYVKVIGDTVVFNKAIFVDRHNQNIATLERTGEGEWVVRSMNPSTTGLHRPPYAPGDTFGDVRTAREKSKDGLSERWFQRDRRLRSLCQPFHGWSIHSWSTWSTSHERRK